jgi:hypothetical protein
MTAKKFFCVECGKGPLPLKREADGNGDYHWVPRCPAHPVAKRVSEVYWAKRFAEFRAQIKAAVLDVHPSVAPIYERRDGAVPSSFYAAPISGGAL